MDLNAKEKARELADMVGSLVVDEKPTVGSYGNDSRPFKRGLQRNKTGSS